ncbi:hypothetical protein LX32DRAFT_204470 [Colletotrichum zoysiae]|uniref:Uncharacterized protein n=1 Tax=Colletotrichum zoysiae TaxID=1216348 RepID=A0AAD9H6G6_9PEZI|nr:hypothetical protein LX32DRAFT_204470 [Colletotrichum zoysiae]
MRRSGFPRPRRRRSVEHVEQYPAATQPRGSVRQRPDPGQEVGRGCCADGLLRRPNKRHSRQTDAAPFSGGSRQSPPFHNANPPQTALALWCWAISFAAPLPWPGGSGVIYHFSVLSAEPLRPRNGTLLSWKHLPACQLARRCR